LSKWKLGYDYARIKNTLDVELNLQVGQNMRGIPQLLQQTDEA